MFVNNHISLKGYTTGVNDATLMWLRVNGGSVSVQNNLIDGSSVITTALNLYSCTPDMVNISNNTCKGMKGVSTTTRFVLPSNTSLTNLMVHGNIGTVTDSGIVASGTKTIVNNIAA
jgi:hypothetical protein